MKKTTPIILSLITNGDEEKQESMTTSLIENNTTSCSYIIYIDTNTIDPLDLVDWKLRNAAYLSDSQPINPQLITIDVELIPRSDFSVWLIENQYRISYEKTSDSIECIHKVKDPDNLRDIELEPVCSSLTLYDIKTQITANGGDFNKDNYNNYVSFHVNGNQIIISLIPFQTKMNCFSFPLLRKIVSNGLNDASIFKFRLVEFDKSAYKSVVIEVEYTAGIPNYYNFSHIPGFVYCEDELNAL